MKAEAVIFDLDGTLVDLDDRELYCINKALTKVGSSTISRRQYIQRYYSRPYDQVGARNLIRELLGKQAAGKAIEIYSNKFRKNLHLNKLQKETFKVLITLKSEGTPSAVATLRRMRSLVEQELQYLHIHRFIDVLVTREDIKPPPQTKPLLNIVAELRAQQFMKTFMLLQTEPSKTIIVGDSWWDIRGAKMVGAIAALVKTGFGTYNHFCREKPDIILDNLEQLLRHIWRLNVFSSVGASKLKIHPAR